MYYLIADIGGTNSRVALTDKNKLIFKKKYKTNKFISLTDMLVEFLAICVDNYKILPTVGVFAIAGKIKSPLKLTNSSLKINKKDITNKTSLKKIYFLNDIEATSYTIDSLSEKDLYSIRKIKSNINLKNSYLIVPGTGLGEANLEYNKKLNRLIPKNKELGHKKFTPKTELQKDIAKFIKKEFKLKTLEFEDLISGKGIERIYSYFVKDNSKYLKAEKISKNQLTCKYAKKTFEQFYELLAQYCQEIVILENSYSNLYLSGTIINKNLKFNKNNFISIFNNHPKYSSQLSKVSISIITKKEVSLNGLIEYIKLFH